MMKFTKLFRLAATITTLFSLAAPGLAYAAGSISLSANKSTVAAGGSLIVAIYVNAGGATVNAVQVDINYPASKLQYVGFSASGGAFEIAATNSGGDGAASIARGTTGAVTGSALVGTVTFKALAGTGSAAIGVSGSSSLVSDGNAVPYGSSGTSVNFGAAAASGSGSAKPAAPAAPAPPKDTAPPVITAIKTKDLTPFSVTITWETNEAADTTVEYGVETNYGLGTSVATPSTTHVAPLTSPFLAPEILLHYRIKSVDAAGNTAFSTDQTVQLPGVPVVVIVRGPDGKPQAGVTVSLDGDNGTTDARGRVTLHTTLGNKKITTNFQGATIQKPITVTKTAQTLPPYQLDLSKKPLNSWMLTSVGLFMMVLVLLAIDGVLFGSRLLARVAGLRFHRSAVAPVAPATPAASIADAEAPPAEPEPAVLDPEKTVATLMEEADLTMPVPLKIELQPLAPSHPPAVRKIHVTHRRKASKKSKPAIV